MNAVNEKPMTQLLAETRKNTAYLRHFVKVVELWEYVWKKMRRDPAVKKCLDAAFPRRRHARWTMRSQQILSGVRAGTVFSMIEYDICIPVDLREHFAETQPVFKNVRSWSVHAPIRRRAQHHNDSEGHAHGQLSRQYDLARHASAAMVSGPRPRGDARLPGHRVRSDSVFTAVRRCSVHGPVRRRRPLTQEHHRGHHEVAGELGLRKDHHQRGPPS